MKPNLIATTAAPLLLLIAWLLIPQTAHCFYNPSTGRWLSRDPLGELGGPNLYGFVGNNPVSRIDPLGCSYDEADGYVYLFKYLMALLVDHGILDDPLQQKLFEHYFRGNGEDLKLSHDEVKSMGPKVMTITQTKEFQRNKRNNGSYTVSDWQFESWATMPQTLNEFTVHLDGKLVICGSKYDFKGTMHISDTYDFDYRGFGKDAPRTTEAEIKTLLVRLLVLGRNYKVGSDKFDYTESGPPTDIVGGQW